MEVPREIPTTIEGLMLILRGRAETSTNNGKAERSNVIDDVHGIRVETLNSMDESISPLLRVSHVNQ